jgi:predicted SAM-dependent methyltransferase
MIIGALRIPIGKGGIMGKTKLHLGCGKRKIAGYINIDINPKVSPDKIANCITLPDFDNETVSVIYTCHMLEHLKLPQVRESLSRWRDILEYGGVLRISVPDFKAICEYYLSGGTQEEVQNLLYGDCTNEYNYHYTCYDFNTLSQLLREVGFSNIYQYDWRTTEHFYIDDYSQSYLPKISYKTRRIGGSISGKLVSLNVEAIK